MLRRFEITPTLWIQCWGFMIGSTFFAVGSFGPVASQIGTTASNVLFFIGSWGFTTAAFVQLQLNGPSRNQRGALRALWLAAATQFVGTILFNVSTGTAITATSLFAEEQLVWAPDAQGSVLFLVSGAFALLALGRIGRLWRPIDRDWLSNWVNMVGCVAFGVSAVAAIVTPGGGVENASLAAWSTFVGAVSFFLASAFVLPDASRKSGAPAMPDANGEAVEEA